tara:strand:- start:3887 stop:4711 length:825 start_codon:yes stop_codon:yes gene_type:complete
MIFSRKVKNNLVILIGLLVLSTISSCTQGPSLNPFVRANTTIEQAIQKKIDDQECCYLEYGVKESVDGRVNKISRTSAVKIHVQYENGRFRGTGTYFAYKGNHIIVTAAHLWAAGPPLVLQSEALVTGPSEKVIGKVIYWDPLVDIAILIVPKMESRNAAKLIRDPQYSVGETVVYSGFPGRNSLLTFQGQLAGDGYGTSLAMHSMAWGGSSGSGVFDSSGRFVGVVSSIMVGRSFLGPQLVGSIVYISPANLIDMEYLKQNLRTMEDKKNEGF